MFHYDSYCLYKNGRPWFPFMGEVHYSRLPANEWHDALLKMKTGGVDVVASYCFWIHHPNDNRFEALILLVRLTF